MVEIEIYERPTELPTATPQRFTPIILLTGLIMLTGIGSVCSVVQTGDALSHTIVTISYAADNDAASQVDSPTLKQDLNRIKESLGLNISEMAAAFGVSRTAIYGWLEGTIPHSRKITRITQLSMLLATSEVPRIKLLKNIPLSNGKTLLQSLALNADITMALTELNGIAAARTSSMEARLARMSRRPRLESADEVSPSFVNFD
jgi:transcriptional regulator with XRE-family HTH domain